MNVIKPYRLNGQWCFDDEVKGVLKEPFVAGMSEMIDRAVGDNHDFALIFCDKEFEGADYVLEYIGDEAGGAWYRCEQLNRIGWFCPVIHKYFTALPANIYVSIGYKVNTD